MNIRELLGDRVKVLPVKTERNQFLPFLPVSVKSKELAKAVVVQRGTGFLIKETYKLDIDVPKGKKVKKTINPKDGSILIEFVKKSRETEHENYSGTKERDFILYREGSGTLVKELNEKGEEVEYLILSRSELIMAE